MSKNDLRHWGASPVGQGFWIAAVVGIAALIYSSLEPGSIWPLLAHKPFRALFVLGMLTSVLAQTSVANFLEYNDLLRCVVVWKYVAPASNLVLAFLAFFAIIFIGEFVHIWFLVLYLGIVVALDWCVAIVAFNKARLWIREAIILWKSHRRPLAILRLTEAKKARLCGRICKSILKKLDFVSFIGVPFLFGVAALLAATGTLGPPATSPSGSAGGHLQFSQLSMRDRTDLFLSGAIGFHLLLTLGLVLSLLGDWGLEAKKV